MDRAKNVDEYIVNAPRKLQDKLRRLREIILSTALVEEERISYGMPYYAYKGRLAYFGISKNHIGLYIPPPIIENHKKELINYGTTKSAIHLPLDKALPISLITKLIKARAKHNEKLYHQTKLKVCSRGHKFKGSGPCLLCWPGYKKR